MRVPRDTDVTLTVGGMIHGGWTAIEMPLSIEALAGSFSLTLTDLDPISRQVIQIPPGAPCSVAINDETIITGYVDDAGVNYDAVTHAVKITGRDHTGDLVDCSAFIPNGPMLGTWGPSVAAEAIIADLCAPFGIPVKAEVPLGVAHFFALQPGEKASSAIERLTRMAGVLAISDGLGGLVLTHGGTGPGFAPLVQGVNIRAASGTYSAKDRFSDYIVIAQSAGIYVGADNTVIAQGMARDPNIMRFRPLVIQAEYANPNSEILNKRANWESTVRAGRALRYTITAQGFRDDAGALWQKNGVAPVRSSFIGIDESLIIAGVKFSFDAQGSRTDLTLTRPDAYQPMPLASTPDFDPAGGAS